MTRCKSICVLLLWFGLWMSCSDSFHLHRYLGSRKVTVAVCGDASNAVHVHAVTRIASRTSKSHFPSSASLGGSLYGRSKCTSSVSVGCLHMSSSEDSSTAHQQRLREKTSFYNSLTRVKEPFRPIHPDKVSYYR